MADGPITKWSARLREGHVFEAGPEGRSHVIDADSKTAPGPVETLLEAIMTCSGVDVVDILAKRRTPVESLEVQVTGQRKDAVPARVTHLLLTYRIRGAGVERVHAERAIQLAVTKYCSVRDSLDPELPVEWRLELEGGEGRGE